MARQSMRGIDKHAKYGIISIIGETAPKSIFWMGSSLKDLKGFPEEIREVLGMPFILPKQAGNIRLPSL